MIRADTLLRLTTALTLAASGAPAQPPLDAKGYQLTQWQMEQLRQRASAPRPAAPAPPVRPCGAEVAVAVTAPQPAAPPVHPGAAGAAAATLLLGQDLGALRPEPAKIVLRAGRSVTIRIVPR